MEDNNPTITITPGDENERDISLDPPENRPPPENEIVIGDRPSQRDIYLQNLKDIQYIIEAIGYKIENPESPESYIGFLIDRGRINQGHFLDEIRDYIPTLKNKYSSHSLTSLQSNAEEKQQYPNLNLLRQILKCNGFNLKSVVRSGGYNRTTGQKITYREYRIDWAK
jgi:hypothetical protein